MPKPEQGGAGQGAFGILLIDKPAGPTSHDVVGWVRWALRERSVGHCGTLDPAATGLLVVCVGAATKLVEHLTAVDKRYLARFVLGRSTTTADAQGETIAEIALPADAVDRAVAELGNLVGSLELPPPAYSAIKIAGRRAHDLARAGEVVELAVRPMTVERLTVVDRGPDWIDVDLTVTKGTYVRSLAEELGRRLDLPAHLGALRRLACGTLELGDPLAVTDLRAHPLPPLEGRAPRWRITLASEAAEPHTSAVEGEAEPPPSEHDRTAAALKPRLGEPWRRLPFPATELSDPDAGPLLERLIQGQRLRADAATCRILGLPHPAPEPPTSEFHALVDRAVGQMILVRHEPEHDRVAPIRVLRF